MQRFLSIPKPKPTIIFIVGGPCSGKSTQTSLIENNFSFERIEISTLIKEELESPYSEHGEIIEECVIQNTSIPSNVILSLMLTTIKCSLCKEKKFIIEDLAAGIENIELWNIIMTEESIIPFLIHLSCSNETIMQRISEIGNGGGADQQQNRLEEIKVEKEVLDMFMAAGKVIEVDGEINKEEVFESISKFLMDLTVGGCKIE